MSAFKQVLPALRRNAKNAILGAAVGLSAVGSAVMTATANAQSKDDIGFTSYRLPKQNNPANMGWRPFTFVTASAAVGSTGIGGQVTTDITDHLNVSLDVSTGHINNISFQDKDDFLNVIAGLHLFSAGMEFRIHPKLENGFYGAVGFLIEHNTGDATMTPYGHFDFGGQNAVIYGPIVGTTDVSLGRTFAPKFTVGYEKPFGRFYLNFALGAAIVGDFQVKNLNFTGMACNEDPSTPGFDPTNNCVNIKTDPTSQAAIYSFRATEKQDINVLPKLVPIVVISVGERFTIRALYNTHPVYANQKHHKADKGISVPGPSLGPAQ